MRSISRRLPIVGLIVLLSGIANAQTVTVTQDYLDSSVKAFAEVLALRKVVEAQQNEIDAYKRLDIARMALIDAKDQTIKAQESQIERLIKIKCNETRYFFGIVKTKRCF